MKIFSAKQVKEWDAFSIAHEGISSYSLMKRASAQFVDELEQIQNVPAKDIHILCGNGNNGGDGICISEILYSKGYNTSLYLIDSESFTADYQLAMGELSINPERIVKLRNSSDLDSISINENSLIIDAIFGSGLNRSVEGFWEEVIWKINSFHATVISVDIPSGVFADKASLGECIFANYTISFQSPKLAFFFPENQDRIGEWIVTPIGLNQSFFEKTLTPYFYINKEVISQIYTPRKKFDHKGTFGASLIMAGSYGKMGAAVLSVKSCLKTGAGLLTTYIPKIGYDILQISVPEAMVICDSVLWNISDIPNLKPYKAIGIGPGIGTAKETVLAVERLIEVYHQPIVFDADSLNILSFRQDLLKKLPKNSILTPHVKEFERLFGTTNNNFERNELQKRMSIELGVIIVLKGAHSCISTPDGNCYFNTTGNPGMATGGSGDVLTGIITSLLSQGYLPREAAILGVYLHGLAGDLAANEKSQESLVASDLIDYLGKCFLRLSK